MGASRMEGIGQPGQPGQAGRLGGTTSAVDPLQQLPTLPLSLPKPVHTPAQRKGADRSKGEKTETVEAKGFEKAEEAYRHNDVLRRKNGWQGFQGRKGREAYAALLEALNPGPKTFVAPENRLGEPTLNYFMRFSAALSEYYRKNGSKVGVSMYAFNPGDDPKSALRRSSFRRRFMLEGDFLNPTV